MNTRPLVSPRGGALSEDSRPFRLHHGIYPRTPLSSSSSESTDNGKGGNSAHVDRERDRRKGHKQEIDWNGEIFGMVEEPDTRKPKFSKQDILVTNRYFHEVLLMKMPYLGEQLARIGRESGRTFTEIEDIVSIALEVSSIHLLKKLLPQIFRGSEKLTLVEMLDIVSGAREIASMHPSPDYGPGHEVKQCPQTLNDISDRSSRHGSQPSSHPSLVSNQVDQQNSVKRKRPTSQLHHHEYSPHSAPSTTTKRLLSEHRGQTECFEDRPCGQMANVGWHNLPDKGRVLDNFSKRAKHELSNDCPEEMTHVLPPQTGQPQTPGNHRLGS
ncbi:MAG: hypothetical protein M1824_006042 [Vezdaea acicularis]|nr:MAG: hypothetical protein M1824_006042 [Vezdaea acicularis]